MEVIKMAIQTLVYKFESKKEAVAFNQLANQLIKANVRIENVAIPTMNEGQKAIFTHIEKLIDSYKACKKSTKNAIIAMIPTGNVKEYKSKKTGDISLNYELQVFYKNGKVETGFYATPHNAYMFRVTDNVTRTE